MTSSDETAPTILRNWLTDGSPLNVTFESGDAALMGRGVLFGLDDNGVDVGFELGVTGKIWSLSLEMSGGCEIKSWFPDDTPDLVVVTLSTGGSKLMLTGPK